MGPPIYLTLGYIQKETVFSLKYDIWLSFFISRVFVVILLFGLVPSLIYEDTFAQVQAQSTSLSAFPRQEVNAGIHNGIQVNVSAHTQSKADYKGLLDNSSDIQKVTYSSNGKKLNATLWLGGEIRGIPSKFGANLMSVTEY